VISGIAMAAGTYVTTVFVSDGSLAAGAAFLWTVIDNAAVVDLYPLDTTLMMNTENTSAANWLATLTWPANRAASAILMKFNLAQIPANAVIQSAVLNLFLTSTDGNSAEPNYTVSLHQIVNRNPDISRANGYAANMFSMWTPNQCCFNGVPMAQADISPARSLTAVNQAAGYKTWDAAAVVRAWVSTPASNYGLLLNADTTKDLGRFRTFASMQDAVASRRPFLRVRYTVSSASASRALVQDTSVRISADFDGDGSLDLSTYRPSTGEWRIWTSSSNFIAHTTTLWGEPGDVAVPADYDGDHRADLAVFRPASGDWHIWLSKTNQPLLVHWGGAGHQPVALDHDGDGKADLGIIRKGHSAILLSSTSYSTSVTFR
jgi:hypothetical protein